MTRIQNTSKKINALLMCHLPLLFAMAVLKFSLTQDDAGALQLNLLKIINIISLSPLALLLLSKFPLNFKSNHKLDQLTPPLIITIVLIIQLKELFDLMGGRGLSDYAFVPQGSLAPLLILGEAMPSLHASLNDRPRLQDLLRKIASFCALALLTIHFFEERFFLQKFIYLSSVSMSILLSLLGLFLFFLIQYRSENSKMLSIILYYCLQSTIMILFLPVFDSQLCFAIIFLGTAFALTLDSIFLRPEALVQNGFSLSLANRRLRDVYEKKVSDSAHLASATLDSLTAQICILDSKGLITEVNRAWRLAMAHVKKADLTSSSEEQFSVKGSLQGQESYIGKNYFSMNPSELGDDPSIHKQLVDVIQQIVKGDLEEFVTTFANPNGNRRQWFMCRITHFVSSQGKCIVVAKEDISDLKLIEEELLLKNAAIERANDGIVLTDPSLPDHPLVYVSPGFLKLTGYTKEEVLGRNCRFLQGPDTNPQTIENIRQAISHEQPFDGDIVNYSKTGKAWINRLRLEPIRNDQGKLLRYLGVQSNVTDQRRLEEELNRALEKERIARLEAERHFQEAKAADSLKDEFLATLSHELRTPAGVIVGFVELLKYEKMSTDEEQEALNAIERNSRSLITLIDDILDVSRVITGKFKLSPKPVDLTSVVESVISAELLAAQAKNIRIVTEFEPGLGPVYGDTTRLQQIFWNLLSNAIKFTPRNGRVKVTLRMDGPRAIVKVSDTGVGIDSKFLPHVFERFRQQDSGMNRAYGGLGLGLSIVKHLVELHGGAVWAESDGPGRGSTFTVSLPVLTASV